MKQDDRVVVSRAAVDWLKKHYPQLCIKAGLCESVGGRLYTKTFSAAPEAPAQGDPLEKLTRIQEELGLYNDKPAQAIPAPWREAVKVAREAMVAVRINMRNNAPHLAGKSWGYLDAALAQLDALEGGE